MDENTYPNMSGLSPNGFVSRAILKFKFVYMFYPIGEGRISIHLFQQYNAKRRHWRRTKLNIWIPSHLDRCYYVLGLELGKGRGQLFIASTRATMKHHSCIMNLPLSTVLRYVDSHMSDACSDQSTRYEFQCIFTIWTLCFRSELIKSELKRLILNGPNCSRRRLIWGSQSVDERLSNGWKVLGFEQCALAMYIL